jgi:hypothetical protein
MCDNCFLVLKEDAMDCSEDILKELKKMNQLLLILLEQNAYSDGDFRKGTFCYEKAEKGMREEECIVVYRSTSASIDCIE